MQLMCSKKSYSLFYFCEELFELRQNDQARNQKLLRAGEFSWDWAI